MHHHPAASLAEQLSCRVFNCLSGLTLWIGTLLAGGSLLCYGVLTLPYASPERGRMLPALVIAGVGLCLILAGRVVYSISLYRLVRDLWGALYGMTRYRQGSLLGWLALLPVVAFFAWPLIWLMATGKIRELALPLPLQRNIRLATMVAIPLLLAGLFFGQYLFWWLIATAAGMVVFTMLGTGVILSQSDAAPSVLAPECRKRMLRSGLFALFLLSFTAAGWLTVWIYLERHIARAEARLAQLGVPSTPEEMCRKYPAPVDNALPQYQAIAELWQQTAAKRPLLFGSRQPDFFRARKLPETVQAAIAPWLAAQAPIAEALETLRPEVSIQFPRDWERGYGQKLPELSILKPLAEYQYLRIDQAVRRGDLEELRKLWRQLRTLRQWSRNGNTLVSYLAGLKIGEMQFSAAQGALNAIPLPDADLQALLRQTEQEEKAALLDYRRALEGEAFSFSYMSQPEVFFRQNAPEAPPSPSDYPSTMIGIIYDHLVPLEWQLRLNRACGQEYFAGLLELAEQDYYLARPKIDAMNDDLDHLPLPLTISRMLLPAFSTQPAVQEVTNLRVLRTALAAELYRRKYGHWPKQLTALVPEFLDAVPLDPFDGRPLRMKSGELTAYELELTPLTPSESEPESVIADDERVQIPASSEFSTHGMAMGVGNHPEQKFKTSYHPVKHSGFAVYSIGADRNDDGGTPGIPGRYAFFRGVDSVFQWLSDK